MILTRLGLLCDLLAVFFLAPELIGIARLQSSVIWLVDRFKVLRTAPLRTSEPGSLAEKLITFLPATTLYRMAAVTLCLILWVLGAIAMDSEARRILLLLAMLQTGYLATTLLFVFRFRTDPRPGCLYGTAAILMVITQAICAVTGTVLTLIFFVPIAVWIRVTATIVLLVLRPFSGVLIRFLERLKDDQTLRSSMVAIGITLFVLQFILQFAGTFFKAQGE